MMSLPSPPNPPASLSALPSPPTSPTSPRTVTTTRTRIKAARSPGSPDNTTSSKGHGERTRSTSPSSSRVASADPDTPGSENRTVARASASVVAGKRRKPSIAYYTPSSPSPWNQRPQVNRASSGVDSHRDGEPVVANGRENVSQRSSLVPSSHSPSTRESVCSSDGVGAREREPLTMVEKHADLLHFIAQKERKCLELRDQLAAHEKELAELKRRWERIVNRGQDPLPNTPLAAGLVALDGLKEGVRMIAAGFSDIGGAIQELEHHDKDISKLTHPPYENNHPSIARAKRTGSEHLSASSMSSIQESAYSSDHVLEGEGGETIATAPPLSRTGSLSYRMHKRTSRAEPTTPTSVFVPPSAQRPKPANLDVGMSLILSPSPTLVPPLSVSAGPASARPASKSPMVGSTDELVPMTAGPMSSWMDNMGRKLSGLQQGQTFSKNKKRASLLLAGVSDTITAALSPGPTATTPAPAPMSTSTTMTPPRILSSTVPRSTSPASTKSSLTTLPPSPRPESQSRPYPSYKSMTDWLDDDDDEQQTVHADRVMLIPDSKQQSRASVSVRATNVAIERGEGTATATATAVTSFDDDDDWNW